MTWAARLLAANPARLFRIGHRKGALDARIATPTWRSWRTIRAATIRRRAATTSCGWTPYAGIELPYRPVATFLRGKMIFDGKDVLAEPGDGAFVRAAVAGRRMHAA